MTDIHLPGGSVTIGNRGGETALFEAASAECFGLAHGKSSVHPYPFSIVHGLPLGGEDLLAGGLDWLLTNWKSPSTGSGTVMYEYRLLTV